MKINFILISMRKWSQRMSSFTHLVIFQYVYQNFFRILIAVTFRDKKAKSFISKFKFFLRIFRYFFGAPYGFPFSTLRKHLSQNAFLLFFRTHRPVMLRFFLNSLFGLFLQLSLALDLIQNLSGTKERLIFLKKINQLNFSVALFVFRCQPVVGRS